MATVHAHVGSLRAGRDVNDGPGRPSSGPVEPVFIACEYDRDLQRYEYRVPVESYGGVAYALRRQRTIVKQLRKLAGMLDVWFDKYPRDVVVRIAHRGVHRLVEDLDDAIARQEQEVS